MSMTSITKDTATLTMTLVSDWNASVARVWQLWADPRQLEQWWGPPTYPATVVDHDLTVGGQVKYWMTGPEGDKHGGWFTFTAVDPPNSLEFEDGFADDSGNPNPNMPVGLVKVALTDHDGGTRMTITNRFPSAESMEQLLAMGMEEGMAAAIGQIDGVLAATP